CSRGRVRVLCLCLGVFAWTASSKLHAADYTWSGVDGANWTVGPWMNGANTTVLGYPASAYAEVGLIRNNPTSIVNSALTGINGFNDGNGATPDAGGSALDESAGGVTLGSVAGSTGGLTIQTRGNLAVRSGINGADVVPGAVQVGTAGIGVLTINN